MLQVIRQPRADRRTMFVDRSRRLSIHCGPWRPVSLEVTGQRSTERLVERVIIPWTRLLQTLSWTCGLRCVVCN